MGSTAILALEPLIPEKSPMYLRRKEFAEAWEEFLAEVRPERALFVGVQSVFLEMIRGTGFQVLKTGKEPWIDLSRFMPKGNSGRGVRAAKNQAIRAGAWIEEWAGKEFVEMRPILEKILAMRSDARWMEVEGFLNSLDPFAIADDRRYFVARTPRRIEGYLVATPIDGKRTYFLEDLILRPDAQRGVGELLTLEAMRALHESGAEKASLGTVSNTELEFVDSKTVATGARVFVSALRRFSSLFYKSGGVELFRKRFKPMWTDSFLALRKTSGRTGARDWIVALVALIRAFEPRFTLNRAALWRSFGTPLRRYPITIFWTALVSAAFIGINHGGALTPEMLDRFGFRSSAPFGEWLYRSLTSDFVYRTPQQFYFSLLAMVPVLGFVERKLPFRTVFAFVFCLSVFDDFLNHLFVILPLKFFGHPAYPSVAEHPEVGSSLLFMGVLGVAAFQFKRIRDLLLGGLSLAVVFVLVFRSTKFHEVVLHVNELAFLVGGYAWGRLHLAIVRIRSRASAKKKTPTMVRSRNLSP